MTKYRAELDEEQGVIMVVAETPEGEMIVGRLEFAPSPQGADSLFLGDVEVDEDYMGERITEKIVEKLAEYVRNKKIRRISSEILGGWNPQILALRVSGSKTRPLSIKELKKILKENPDAYPELALFFESHAAKTPSLDWTRSFLEELEQNWPQIRKGIRRLLEFHAKKPEKPAASEDLVEMLKTFADSEEPLFFNMNFPALFGIVTRLSEKLPEYETNLKNDSFDTWLMKKNEKGKLVEEKITPPRGYRPQDVLDHGSFEGTLWHKPLISFSISRPEKARGGRII